MAHDALGPAVEQLAALMRPHPEVVMVADGYDDDGPHIIVLVEHGATIPGDVPDEVLGYRVKVEFSEGIVLHEP